MKDIDKELVEALMGNIHPFMCSDSEWCIGYDDHKEEIDAAIKDIKQLINQAYGRGTVDTLNHIKKWADKTEVTYNDMIKDRIKELKGE